MVLEAIPLPLSEDEGGVIRVGGTRVALESVLWGWRDGATPEGIAEDFPALTLADVYAALAYALARPAEADAYLERADAEERAALGRLTRRFPQHGLRERLHARAQE